MSTGATDEQIAAAIESRLKWVYACETTQNIPRVQRNNYASQIRATAPHLVDPEHRIVRADINVLSPELRDALRFAAAVLRDTITTANDGDELCAELLAESFHAAFPGNDGGDYERYLAVIDAALADSDS